MPYQTLAILIDGYFAYRFAYVGRDSTHRTIDTAAIVLESDWAVFNVHDL